MSSIKLNSKQIVDLKNYSKRNVPDIVTEHKLNCPYPRQYVLRVPIMVDGENYKIPKGLGWLTELITEAITHQREEYGVKHTFCYVTVRHGKVRSETDDEWHVDGFSTKITHIPEQNYIICDHTPTEYIVGGVDFPDDFDPRKHNVNNFLESALRGQNVKCIPENTLCVMDPYILHRRPNSTAGSIRTFVRISFVPIEINDVNNTQNPLLLRDYTNEGVVARDKLEIYRGDILRKYHLK
jgi:hypothetical protein